MSLDRSSSGGLDYLARACWVRRGQKPGSDQTYCAFKTNDIEAAHESLRNKGVIIDTEIAREGNRRPGLVSVEVTIADPVPPQFFLRDLDGNRFLIVEAE